MRGDIDQLVNFLYGLRGDVFKLLPLREASMKGEDKHVGEYIEVLLINLKGAMGTYPVLNKQKQFLYVVNNLQFLLENIETVRFNVWRRIVLNATSNVNSLFIRYGGTEPHGRRRKR